MYGTSSSNVLSGALASSIATMAFMVIAFIAAIIVTIVLYKKFIPSTAFAKVNGKRNWAAFFRFDHLIVENILKMFYIFTSSFILFGGVAFLLGCVVGIAANPAGSLVGMLLAILAVLVFELLNRVGFEMTMLTILIWKNTSVIRSQVTGEAAASQMSTSAPSTGFDPTAPVAAQAVVAAVAPAAPVAPAPQAPTVAAPADQGSAESPSWTCPHCATVNEGRFCTQCGAPRK